jgi:hypothetical protein
VRPLGGQIRIADGSTGFNGIACPIPGTHLGSATVLNTDKIVIFGSGADVSAGDGYTIDMRQGFLGPGATPEQDGVSEIEVAINTPGIAMPLAVEGTDVTDPVTKGNDEIRVGAGGQVNLGYNHFGGLDLDVDVTTSTAPRKAYLYGFGGNDFLTGGGDELTHIPGPAAFPIEAHGGDGDDQVNGGRANDDLYGDQGADRYRTVDARHDHVTDFGTDGRSDFADVDTLDTPFVTGVEQTVVESPTAP